MNGTEIGELVSDSIIKALPGTFITLVKILWPIYIPAFIITSIKIAYEFYKHQQMKKAGMEQIDKMTGPDFEEYLKMLFEKMGYKTQKIGSLAGDYGADLIIEKNGERTAVQAKRWNSHVGIDAVREVYGPMKLYNCTKSLVVTTSGFTRQAQILAESDNVQLWDRSELVKAILSVHN